MYLKYRNLHRAFVLALFPTDDEKWYKDLLNEGYHDATVFLNSIKLSWWEKIEVSSRQKQQLEPIGLDSVRVKSHSIEGIKVKTSFQCIERQILQLS